MDGLVNFHLFLFCFVQCITQHLFMQMLTTPVLFRISLPLNIVQMVNIMDDKYISNVELHLWSNLNPMYIHACM